MTPGEYEEVLELFKCSLGISHKVRDEYYRKLLVACEKELKGRGIYLEEGNLEDEMLLADYTGWKYQDQNESIEMPKNLRLRIQNKKIAGRAGLCRGEKTRQ